MKDEQLPFFDPDAEGDDEKFNFDEWAKMAHSKDLISDEIQKIDRLFTRKEIVAGLPTGFKNLDVVTGGLRDGDLIVIGGRLSMGKTALASAIVEHVAIDRKDKAAYFSLGLSRQILMRRMVASRAKVDVHKVNSGFLSESDWPRLIKAADELRTADIFTDDTAIISLKELRAKALWLKKNRGIKLLVIDYIQLLHDFVLAEERPKRIEKLSRALKDLAIELNLPVIVLSQLSEYSKTSDIFYPSLIDLPGNGVIAQSADLILLLVREEYYMPTDDNHGLAKVITAKNRKGPVGTIQLFFRKECMRFENLNAY